jgi:DNA-3-methyladenine glycosylase II
LARADLDYAALHRMSDAAVCDRLTALTGIGPWTAQIYVMFCLGRADMFPPGDLALQVAAQALFGLQARPKPAELAAMAQDWSPWRSVAARALFAYYRVVKNREGLA